jgi:uncharacterized DUF497 family protein
MEINSFKWDEDTIVHIANHAVSPEEVEEVAFENLPYIRKGKQGRRYLYGKTIGGRYLFTVYIVVGPGEAKVITSRDMDDKERKLYLKRGK